jgi:2-polyprenyl-6-methoxyphenol hydroxylase-like FAD-dependent oxidoreductase
MLGRVVVVGGGIGGLATSLAFARAGQPVTLYERDPTVPTRTAAEAFEIERRGAPQSHQTHGFLARIMVLLRERFPDVLERLLAEGCTTLPGAANLGAPQPGDEDLRVLIVRRTTLEWVLRSAVAAEPLVDLRAGVGVGGLVVDGSDAPAAVEGVVTEAGERVEAAMVVAATGRRGDVPGWLAAHGVEVAEKVDQSGLMYLTRWYRLPDGFDVTLDAKLGGDLGYVKFLGVPGDGRTLSVTLALRTADRELREALGSPDRFESACRALPGPDRFFRGPRLEPLGGVRPMTGLVNRIRRFTAPDGSPLVLGLHAVGDAHTCTNPLYGRGCTLAVLQAVLLVDAAAAHPGDPAARAAAYEQACRQQVEPWWQVSVQTDKAGADPAGLAGGVRGRFGSEAGQGIAALFAAAATDPVIGRGMARFWNLLATPAELMADAELMARVAEVVQNRDRYPLPSREGPTRQELLELLAT